MIKLTHIAFAAALLASTTATAFAQSSSTVGTGGSSAGGGTSSSTVGTGGSSAGGGDCPAGTKTAVPVPPRPSAQVDRRQAAASPAAPWAPVVLLQAPVPARVRHRHSAQAVPLRAAARRAVLSGPVGRPQGQVTPIRPLQSAREHRRLTAIKPAAPSAPAQAKPVHPMRTMGRRAALRAR